VYHAFLVIHSLFRWVVLALALTAVVTTWAGWMGRRPWTAAQKRIDTFFVISVDIQLLLGLVLYVALSPLTHAAFAHFGHAMKDDVLRFWAVEHIGIMILAIALVHVGHALSKKAAEELTKFKRAAVFFTLALVLFLVGIPWPFMAVGRPLLRF
jgi:hypothetical protein